MATRPLSKTRTVSRTSPPYGDQWDLSHLFPQREQDVGRALEISDRGFVLEKGSITRAEQASVLLSDAYVREAFLGIQ